MSWAAHKVVTFQLAALPQLQVVQAQPHGVLALGSVAPAGHQHPRLPGFPQYQALPGTTTFCAACQQLVLQLPAATTPAWVMSHATWTAALSANGLWQCLQTAAGAAAYSYWSSVHPISAAPTPEFASVGACQQLLLLCCTGQSHASSWLLLCYEGILTSGQNCKGLLAGPAPWVQGCTIT